MTEPEQEVCRISVMFPVSSDEHAIEMKRKIKAVLSDVPDVRFEFTLIPIPPKRINPNV